MQMLQTSWFCFSLRIGSRGGAGIRIWRTRESRLTRTLADRVGSPEFGERWGGRPVLVVHAKQDRHIPADPVDRAVRAMRRRFRGVTDSAGQP